MAKDSEGLLQALDQATRDLYDTRKSSIYERSGTIKQDLRETLAEINASRKAFDLEPITDEMEGL